MSWMSPFTVAITTGPRFADASAGNAARTTSNAALAASAAIRSCGRNTVPASNPLPTTSNAGTISPSITSTG